MAKKDVRNYCIVCGKPLEPHVCSKCKGSGQVKAGLLGKRACDACAGTGTLRQCPDWLAHYLQRPSKLGTFGPKPVSGKPPVTIHQTCPLCKGTKGIRMPFTGQAGPCPRCKGKGWV